jgi:hypothetical protein
MKGRGTMRAVYIVEQKGTSCRGRHVEPEQILLNGKEWVNSDRKYPNRPGVEKMTQQEGESDEAFYQRLNQRADVLDREYGCSRCYR